MHHSVGGVLATGALLVGGGSVVIRERFSAQHFWSDVVRWDCTLFQYIGELCRYLLHTEPHPREKDHRIRMCCGNGLRPDVWNAFKERFRIPQILEFYAATEGNVSLVNVEGMPGAIGRIPPFLAHRFPAALVQYDTEADAPVRDARGFCVRCAANEVGEAIGPVLKDRSNVGSRFEGYTNEQAAEKKILRDVFEPGDAWVRTGDLMRQGRARLFLFRRSDWRHLPLEGRERCHLRGVGGDLRISRDQRSHRLRRDDSGRRGPGRHGHHRDRWRARSRRLPRASRSTACQVMRARYSCASGDDLEVTATFKHTKSALMREGYDPVAIGDALYFNDRERQAFVRLDKSLYDRIQSGEALGKPQ